MNSFGRRWLAGLLLGASVCGWAQAGGREDEIAQCLPGEISTWRDGVDRPAIASSLHFVYNHADAPTWFTSAQVLAVLRKAATAWSACGIPSRVEEAGPAMPAGAVKVQWSESGSRGNFGLANLGDRTLSLGPAAFDMLRTRNPRYDAAQALQMVVSHEMGHLYGLMAHSHRCVDTMSYYHNGQGEQCHLRDRSLLKTVPEYRSALPTACDIQRCRQANPAAQVAR